MGLGLCAPEIDFIYLSGWEILAEASRCSRGFVSVCVCLGPWACFPPGCVPFPPAPLLLQGFRHPPPPPPRARLV